MVEEWGKKICTISLTVTDAKLGQIVEYETINLRKDTDSSLRSSEPLLQSATLTSLYPDQSKIPSNTDSPRLL